MTAARRPSPPLLVMLAVALAIGVVPAGAQDPGGADAVVPLERALVMTVPDGNDPFRLSGSRAVVIVEPGGDVRRLVDGDAEMGAVSPDALHVVYTAGRGAGGIRIVGVDGARDRGLATSVMRTLPQPWSPDGAEVLAIRSPDLIAVDVATGVVRTVLATTDQSVTDAVWSPDGSHVAVVLDDGAVLVTPAGGGTPVAIGERVQGELRWSPDGNRIAALVMSPDGSLADLVLLDPDGAAPAVAAEALPTDFPGLSGPEWAPGGGAIAIGVGRTVRIVDAGGRQMTAIELPDPTGNNRLDLVTWDDPVGPLAATGDGRLVQVTVDGEVITRAVALPYTPYGMTIAPVATPPQPATVARALWASRQRPEGTTATVLIGRHDDFGDSLSSGGPQGLLDAVLLLTPSDRLDPAVAEEITRLGATQAIILGGPAAISPAVEVALAEKGLAVTRIAGDTRITTAVAVADRLFTQPPVAVVARAFGDEVDPTRGFADSLAAGALAAGLDAPLLLTHSEATSPELLAWLDRTPSVEEVLVIGGEAAIADAVLSGLAGDGRTITRVGGADRTQTAAAVRALGSEHRVGDDLPSGSALVVVDAADPLAWADGFAVAGQADPTQGGGVLLGVGRGTAVAQPQATAAALLDAPAASTVRCAPLLLGGGCRAVRDIHQVGGSDPVLTAHTTEGEVMLDADVHAGPIVCIDVRLEGAGLTAVEVTGPSWELPAPIGGRSTLCHTQDVGFPGTPAAGDAVTVTLGDDRTLTATLEELTADDEAS